MFIELNER